MLHPWDNIPRFDFLECNLANIFTASEPYQTKKKTNKDRFIGNINQLKTTQAKKVEKKGVSSFDKQLKESKEKYRNLVTAGGN